MELATARVVNGVVVVVVGVVKGIVVGVGVVMELIIFSSKLGFTNILERKKMINIV